MRDEIVTGLRNAIERGENISQAMQSFLNAGYNPFEVKAAAQLISSYGGASEIVNSEQIQNLPEQRAKKSSGKTGLIIGVIIAALILLGAIGFLAYTLLTK
jgi:hypothetical protein